MHILRISRDEFQTLYPCIIESARRILPIMIYITRVAKLNMKNKLLIIQFFKNYIQEKIIYGGFRATNACPIESVQRILLNVPYTTHFRH